MSQAVQDSLLMGRITVYLALALLSACATNPITGRDQILALPAVQAAYADVRFALSAGAPRIRAPHPMSRSISRAA